MSTSSEKTSAAFKEWQQARAERLAHGKVIQDALKSDAQIEEAVEERRVSSELVKTLTLKFKAKNEAALARLDELKEAEQEAKLSFDALYVSCVMGGEQLSLFDDFGAEVELVTRVRIEKRDKKAEPVAQD
jgi:hypothetical protein